MYNLPDIIDNPHEMKEQRWAALIKEAIKRKYEDELKSKMKQMTKLKDSQLVDENFGMQDYIKNMT